MQTSKHLALFSLGETKTELTFIEGTLCTSHRAKHFICVTMPFPWQP